jgi:ABC-type nitrate/sulfonate/bicarbonate transport system permease component
MTSYNHAQTLLSRFCLGSASIIVAICFWEAAVRIHPRWEPASFGVIAILHQIFQDRELLVTSALFTCLRALSGLFIALAIAVFLGFWMSLSSRADYFFGSLVDVLRPIPSASLILLWQVLIGGSLNVLFVVAFGCAWPILLNIRDRYRHLPKEIEDSLRILELSTWSKIRAVYSRALLPGILDGLRVALSISLILTITVEIVVESRLFLHSPRPFGISNPLAVPPGLGMYLNFHSQNQPYTGLLAGIVVSGLLGFVMNTAYQVVYTQILCSQHIHDCPKPVSILNEYFRSHLRWWNRTESPEDSIRSAAAGMRDT